MGLRIDRSEALQVGGDTAGQNLPVPSFSAPREPALIDKMAEARPASVRERKLSLPEPKTTKPATPAKPTGPLETTTAEYRMPAAVDPSVLDGRATEIWARVYRPNDLSGGPFPVVVMLHGNHATCGHGANPRIDDNTQYTTSGTCPAGYEVVPNHEGYAEAARDLASHGYIVVSINANRGITAGGGVSGDSGLNLARGRLVLRHLELLSGWNKNGGTPPSLGVELQGKLDLTNVGLMGHSRGGEGVRAAYNLYRDEGSPWPARIGTDLGIKGIFEIGPVDGQTSRVLDATGTSWTVLLPMSDGDVSDLQGIRPFDRMIDDAGESSATPKATFSVWGTNHNFYNSEWQRSDASSWGNQDPVWRRPNGPAQQRQVGYTAMTSFFRAHVGRDADPRLGQLFNPANPLPEQIATITPIERGYIDTPNAAVTRVFERFDKPAGTNTYGAANDAANVTVAHRKLSEHNPSYTGADLSWTQSGTGVYFQSNWEVPGSGRDVADAKTLTFRVSRKPAPRGGQLPPSTDFSVQLVQADGTLTKAVPLSGYLTLGGPAVGPGGPHSILQTVRIPLAAFPGVDRTKVRGVRFTFDRSPTGAIYLGDLSFSNREAGDSSVAATTSPAVARQAPLSVTSRTGVEPVNTGRIVRTEAITNASGTEIEIESDAPFLPGGPLYVLRMGGREYRESRYPDDGNTRRIIFRVDDGFARESGPIEVATDTGAVAKRWRIR